MDGSFIITKKISPVVCLVASSPLLARSLPIARSLFFVSRL